MCALTLCRVSDMRSLTMYESFLEIAFEAELNTDEGPELLEAARELCNENPITRPAAITELRALILVRYCAFREQYSQLQEGVDLWGLSKVKDAYEGVIYDRPDYGRISLAFPTRLLSCHIINYSWILNTFFYIFKRFIPQKAWSTIFFHGNDLKSLQGHIDKECLPPRFGGTSKNCVSSGTWLKKIKKYRDEKFDREMKGLGYVVKE
ncbi:CRAL/TRIO domain-containing protein, partial [Operophtera brumata]